MRFEGLDNAVKYSKAYKRKKLRQRIVSGLAAVVVFITTYALILPAITKERETFCGFEEHSHNSACLADGCQLPEHVHTDDCYADKNGTESESDWESTLPKTLSGDWTKDILSVAESQLGYKESMDNVSASTADEATYDEAENRGYTRYGDWYGRPYGDWSAIFVNFCLNYAGVDKSYFPYEAELDPWMKNLEEKALFKDVPAKGDVIFFRGDKAGIVSDLIYDGESMVRVRTIQGDVDGRVAYREYSVTDESIIGYGDMTKAYEEFDKNQPITKVYADDSVGVKAVFMPSAGIPKDATLVVKPIDIKNSPEEFNDKFDLAQKKLDAVNGEIKKTEITGFRLYDIHFLHEGNEIQPTEKVEISITYPVSAYSTTAAVSVIHYTDDGTEMPETEHSIDEDGNLVADFETESFSLFAIVTSESTVKSIVALSQVTATASNITSQAYAIINGDHALGVDGTNAVVTKVKTENSILSADESLVRWNFVSSGSGYYIKTTVDGTEYYLQLSDGAFALSTSGTLFTVSVTSGNITVHSGNGYLNLSESGVTAGSSMALSLYNLPTGEFSVTFDGTIDKAQYMGSNNYKYSDAEKVVTQTTDGYITLPTPEETKVPGNYPLRLNGWYDIINSVYYDSSMFGASIRITTDTIFYPEWVAETYDIGQNKNVVATQPDTSDFIETRVFDYNELFNVHSSYYNASDNKWYFDENSELGFVFFDYICHSSWGNDWGKTGGNIGNIEGKNVEIDGVSVNAEKTNGTRGSSTNFPGTITEGIATEARLNALFGDDPIVGRVALGEGDWLYCFDDATGFYYYNSAANAASYNQSEQRFYVYNNIVTIDSQNSLNDFLPFNYADADTGDTEFAEKDNEANYWFGMSSEIRFYLPNDSGSGNNKSVNGTDLQFRFSGDDDVWIFVDDQLVLDLGGVHDVVYGEINFSTGVVKTGQAIASDNIADNAAATHEEMPGLTGTTGITEYTLPTLKGGEEHTLTVYYLERGSSLSNCAVYFNLSPLQQLSLVKEDADGGDLLAGATFQVYSDEACTTPATLYQYDENGNLVQLPDAKFTSDENGIATCYGLFAGETYYIKEIESPDGYSDMSKYVIKFSLAGDGNSAFVVIDSDGGQFQFAGEYKFDINENHMHMIELHIYNSKYVGGDQKVFVEKVWDTTSEDIPDEVIVWLYANGENTNRSMSLNESNGWQGTFLELPKYDSDGNEIIYTVREEALPGYSATYEEITEIGTPGYWNRVTSLTSGNSYFFFTAHPDEGGKALGASNNALAILDADSSSTYQQWQVNGSGTSFTFYNNGSQRYLYASNWGSSASLNRQSRTFTYSNNVLTYSNKNLYYDGSSFSMTNSNSTQFYAYEWVESTVTELDYPGWRIINTPWGESFGIPVEKLWGSTVSESDKKEISVDLYLVTETSDEDPVLKGTLVLNQSNSWKSQFTDLEYPAEGQYYAIVETTEGFDITYSGETVLLTLAETEVKAHKVIIGDDGNGITAQITNNPLIVLPETGGFGKWAFLTSGAMLVLFAAILLLKPYKRIKK